MNAAVKLVDLCAADMADGEIRKAYLPCGRAVAIYRVEGEYYVTDDVCSHGEASLSEDGMLDGYEVECSWHFGRFDVRSGEPCAMPCERPIQTWPAIVDGDRVLVDAGEESA